MDPAAARQALTDGHTRVITGRPLHPNQTDARRAEVALSPCPFAVIIGCMDARVPPEIIFDLGLGDLFVIRVAGGAITEVVLGSVEVAVRDFGVPLVVVLGHERCRAVQTVVEVCRGERTVVGHTGSIVDALRPAVAPVADQPGDCTAVATRASVGLAVARLRSAAPLLAERARSGELEVAGWLYDVDTGIIEMIV